MCLEKNALLHYTLTCVVYCHVFTECRCGRFNYGVKLCRIYRGNIQSEEHVKRLPVGRHTTLIVASIVGNGVVDLQHQELAYIHPVFNLKLFTSKGLIARNIILVCFTKRCSKSGARVLHALQYFAYQHNAVCVFMFVVF